MSKDTSMRTLALLALAIGASGCASVDTVELSQDALAAPGVAYNAMRRAAAREVRFRQRRGP